MSKSEAAAPADTIVTPIRIYKVEQEGHEPRLIKAVSANAAMLFVIKPQITASVPGLEEYGNLLTGGIQVEDSTK